MASAETSPEEAPKKLELSAYPEHQKHVAAIAEKVKGFCDRQAPFRIYHGSTNSTRTVAFSKDKMIDTSGLSNVLHIDKESHIALVEPNVPMDCLVKETLEYGLIPPVVMEFPGITVGGGFSGTSGESSSFKHGSSLPLPSLTYYTF